MIQLPGGLDHFILLNVLNQALGLKETEDMMDKPFLGRFLPGSPVIRAKGFVRLCHLRKGAPGTLRLLPRPSFLQMGGDAVLQFPHTDIVPGFAAAPLPVIKLEEQHQNRKLHQVIIPVRCRGPAELLFQLGPGIAEKPVLKAGNEIDHIPVTLHITFRGFPL